MSSKSSSRVMEGVAARLSHEALEARGREEEKRLASKAGARARRTAKEEAEARVAHEEETRLAAATGAPLPATYMSRAERHAVLVAEAKARNAAKAKTVTAPSTVINMEVFASHTAMFEKAKVEMEEMKRREEQRVAEAARRAAEAVRAAATERSRKIRARFQKWAESAMAQRVEARALRSVMTRATPARVKRWVRSILEPKLGEGCTSRCCRITPIATVNSSSSINTAVAPVVVPVVATVAPAAVKRVVGVGGDTLHFSDIPGPFDLKECVSVAQFFKNTIRDALIALKTKGTITNRNIVMRQGKSLGFAFYTLNSPPVAAALLKYFKEHPAKLEIVITNYRGDKVCKTASVEMAKSNTTITPQEAAARQKAIADRKAAEASAAEAARQAVIAQIAAFPTLSSVSAPTGPRTWAARVAPKPVVEEVIEVADNGTIEINGEVYDIIPTSGNKWRAFIEKHAIVVAKEKKPVVYEEVVVDGWIEFRPVA